MNNPFIYISSLLEGAFYFIWLSSFVKQLHGSLLKLAVLFFLLLLRSWTLDILEPQMTTAAYANLITSAIYIFSVCFSIKNGFRNGLSTSVLIYGTVFILGLAAELIATLIISMSGLLPLGEVNYWVTSLYIYTVILALGIISSLTIAPPIVTLIINRAHQLKNFALIIVNCLFGYFIFRQYTVVKDFAYYYYPIPIALFITTSIVLYKEIMDVKNINAMLAQHRKIIETIQPILQDIRSRQHDFKNQLNVIRLSMELHKNHSEDLVKTVETLHSQIIANDSFLTLPNQTLGALIYIKYHEASSRDILLQVFSTITGDMPLPMEEYALTSVLSNLIDNAIEACQPDLLGEKKVIVQLDMENENFKINVSNTGEGIPPHLLSQLFKRGFTNKQLDDGQSLRQNGLYNVRKLVEQSNGHISISSEADKTIFEVILPGLKQIAI